MENDSTASFPGAPPTLRQIQRRVRAVLAYGFRALSLLVAVLVITVLNEAGTYLTDFTTPYCQAYQRCYASLPFLFWYLFSPFLQLAVVGSVGTILFALFYRRFRPLRIVAAVLIGGSFSAMCGLYIAETSFGISVHPTYLLTDGPASIGTPLWPLLAPICFAMLVWPPWKAKQKGV